MRKEDFINKCVEEFRREKGIELTPGVRSEEWRECSCEGAPGGEFGNLFLGLIEGRCWGELRNQEVVNGLYEYLRRP